MSRRVHRVPVHLHPAPGRPLPASELAAILRGADPLVMRGGRTLLAHVLRGSRQKKVLELGLDRIPVHGFYRGVAEEEVFAKIDG